MLWGKGSKRDGGGEGGVRGRCYGADGWARGV